MPRLKRTKSYQRNRVMESLAKLNKKELLERAMKFYDERNHYADVLQLIILKLAY